MSTSNELTCRELVEIVTEYLEGAMPPQERARFDEHLVICDGCRGYLDQMRTTIAVLGRLPVEQVPPEAQRDLLAAFRSWKRGAGQ
ncbi:MAG: zf-HC2 domain-containing protein [Kouleothrix sp.]|nr:zf-HC2 domain-containing protein [Kouleothrix sp.]